MAPLLKNLKGAYHVIKEHFKDHETDQGKQEHEEQSHHQRDETTKPTNKDKDKIKDKDTEPGDETGKQTKEQDHDPQGGVTTTNDNDDRTGSNKAEALGAQATVEALGKMSIEEEEEPSGEGDRNSDDQGKNADDKGRDSDHGKGAKWVRPDVPLSDNNYPDQLESKSSSPKEGSPQKSQFTDALREEPKALEGLGSPSRRSRHVRHKSNHNITFRDEQASAVAAREPLQVLEPVAEESEEPEESQWPSDVPPVPPIPEAYREEWEKQQEARRLKNVVTDNDENAGFVPGGKKSGGALAKRGLAARNRINTSRDTASQDHEKGIGKAVTRDGSEGEGNRHGSEVPGELETWGKDWGIQQLEHQSKADAAAAASGDASARQDYRLPRSPAMPDLARSKAGQHNTIPEPTTPTRRSKLPVPLHRQSLHTKTVGSTQTAQTSLLNRKPGDMTKTYVEGMINASVAEMKLKQTEAARGEGTDQE